MKALTIFLSVLLFLTLIALNIPVYGWWGFSVLGLLAPLLWVGNFIMLFYWLWKPSWWIVPTVAALIAGAGLMGDTVAFSTTTNPHPDSWQVLTYNVSHFGKPKGYNFERDSSKLKNIQQTREFIAWVVTHPAPVKCFQEFYSFPGNPLFDVDRQLKAAGWEYSYLSADTLSVNKSRFGVATYSRFPIAAHGTIYIGSNRFNRGIWTDIVVDQDTIRILNVHMQSAQLQRTSKKSSGLKDKLRKMFWMYRASQRAQNEQLQQIRKHISESPYPVLLSGDLNSHPFSRIYQLLEQDLSNAFEQKGRGFGFTFNHPKLFFLRIDHQFVSDPIETQLFRTRQDVDYSEHYPLEGWFRLKNKY